MTYTIRHVIEIEERVEAANDKAAQRAVSLGRVSLQLIALKGVQHVGFLRTDVIDSIGTVVSQKRW